MRVVGKSNPHPEEQAPRWLVELAPAGCLLFFAISSGTVQRRNPRDMQASVACTSVASRTPVIVHVDGTVYPEDPFWPSLQIEMPLSLSLQQRMAPSESDAGLHVGVVQPPTA